MMRCGRSGAAACFKPQVGTYGPLPTAAMPLYMNHPLPCARHRPREHTNGECHVQLTIVLLWFLHMHAPFKQ